MEHKVTGCIDCCFQYDGRRHETGVCECLHPNSVGDIEIDSDEAGGWWPITPDNCPLNTEPITITKE
jgi:hypothetical protein